MKIKKTLLKDLKLQDIANQKQLLIIITSSSMENLLLPTHRF